jgi:choline dehydrogenase-like flavoprotein
MAKSADPLAAPAIKPNYLSAEDDKRVAAEAIRLTRRIVAQPALRRFAPEEFRPGAEIVDTAALSEAAGRIGTTIFHPVGTCKMGGDNDPGAVVDARLRVRGLCNENVYVQYDSAGRPHCECVSVFLGAYATALKQVSVNSVISLNSLS